jgi:hypothetical protein
MDISRIVLLLIISLVCFMRRKFEIGGWLLFYFISVVLSAFMWLALTIPALQLFNPSCWSDSGRYLLFIVTAVPNDLLLIGQFIVSMMLILKRFRDWKYVNCLRIILLSQIVFSLILLPLDISLSPQSIPLDLIAMIAPVVWLLYFSLSKRIRSVYKDKDWVSK